MNSYAIVNSDGQPNSAILEIMKVLELPNNNTLKNIVEITQEKFFQKKDNLEIPHLREKIMPILDKLNMLKEITPIKRKYDNALMLGELFHVIKKRLSFLEMLWNQDIRFDRIVFLGGERPLDEKREISVMLLDNANKKLPKTELEMMKMVWDEEQLLQEMKQVKTQWVNAFLKPNEKGERIIWPNTGDTIKKWLERNPSPGTCLAISNNPYIGYQNSVLKTYLPKGFEVETVGQAASLELPLALYLGEMARWLYQEQIRLDMSSKS